MFPNILASGLGEGILLTCVGMSVVFLSLTVLIFVTKGIKVVTEEKPAPPPAPTPTPPTAVEDDKPSPELIAVLTAAAAAALGRPVRIHQVRRYWRPAGEVWRQQGIRNLTTGHRPNRW